MTVASALAAHETVVEFLRHRAWPGEAPIEIETHLSRVFLVADRAYKLKKPVRLDFVDARRPEARRRDCLAEVQLNDALAPDVYLGVATISRALDGSLQLDRRGEAVDWLVVMRRLHRSDLLDQRLHHVIRPEQLMLLAAHLARFYRRTAALPASAPDHRVSLQRALHTDRVVLERHLDLLEGAVIDTTFARMHAAIDAGVLDNRARHLVDAHGDLRPEHIRLGDRPLVIDRVTYDAGLRRLDPFDDLALLAVELEVAGRADLVPVILADLGEQLHELPSTAVWSFYRARRATTRARLSIAHLDDHPLESARWTRRALGYLQIAARLAAVP